MNFIIDCVSAEHKEYGIFGMSYKELVEYVESHAEGILPNGQPHRLEFFHEEEEVDNEGNDNPILDWCYYASETTEIVVVRNRYSPHRLLITQLIIKSSYKPGWSYTEKESSYQAWEDMQIAEFERRHM